MADFKRTAAAAAAICVMIMSFAGCSDVGGDSRGNSSDTVSSAASGSTSDEVPATEPETAPPAEDKRVHFIAAGDNLIHYSVFKAAEANAGPGERYDFGPIYENMRYIIESADVAIINQENIISESNPVRGADGGAPQDSA